MSEVTLGQAAIDEALKSYTRCQRMYMHVLTIMETLQKPIKDGGATTENLVDMALVARAFADLFEEMRKRASAVVELCGYKIAYDVTTLNLQNPDTIIEKITGQFGTGTPDVNIAAKLPKKGSSDYRELMTSFGLRTDIINQDVIEADWKGLASYVSKLTREGKNLPPGIGKTYPQFKCDFRLKQGVKFDLTPEQT